MAAHPEPYLLTTARPDHRAVGRELVRSDRKVPPLFLALLYSPSLLLLVGGVASMPLSAVLGTLELVLGGIGTWLAAGMWREVVQARAHNARDVTVVFGLKTVRIEARGEVQEELSMEQALAHPLVAPWGELHDLVRVRHHHARMNPRAPSKLVLEWLALQRYPDLGPGPVRVWWRGPDDAPRIVDAPPDPEAEVYEVTMGSEPGLDGIHRPRWDVLPRRASSRSTTGR